MLGGAFLFPDVTYIAKCPLGDHGYPSEDHGPWQHQWLCVFTHPQSVLISRALHVPRPALVAVWMSRDFRSLQTEKPKEFERSGLTLSELFSRSGCQLCPLWKGLGGVSDEGF